MLEQVATCAHAKRAPYLGFDGPHAIVVAVDDHVLAQRGYHLIRHAGEETAHPIRIKTCKCY